MTLPNYLALGHITRDMLPHGALLTGGTAFYAAYTAYRLGLRAAILTALPAGPAELIGTADVVCMPSESASTFENRYAVGVRRQWLHAVAAPLDLAYLPGEWFAAPIVHLAPVLNECSLEMIDAFPNALIGVTPQGWMRRWEDSLPSPIRRERWRPDRDLLSRVDVLVVSVEDIADDMASVRYYASCCPVVVLTRGAEGLTLYRDGEPLDIPAFPALERDPTGAGDVFTAAMLCILSETGDAVQAAHFAAVVAAMSVEDVGASSIPSRGQAVQRMRSK